MEMRGVVLLYYEYQLFSGLAGRSFFAARLFRFFEIALLFVSGQRHGLSMRRFFLLVETPLERLENIFYIGCLDLLFRFTDTLQFSLSFRFDNFLQFVGKRISKVFYVKGISLTLDKGEREVEFLFGIFCFGNV